MRRAGVLALLFSTSCALATKGKPVEIRYFAPDRGETSTTTTTAATATPAEAPPKIAVGRITSSAFLREKIVWRKAGHETGVYDDLRWTEYPEEYLRRSLARALFQSGRFVHGVGSGLPTLDVELLAFEEAQRGDARAGRVQLVYRLHDRQAVLASGALVVDRAADRDDGIAGVVAAIGAALDEATARLSAGLAAQLAH